MRQEELEGHSGQRVVIDLCHRCQSFWFDARESLSLTPGSTLTLFRVIGEHIAERQPSVGSETAKCPRCRGRLRLIHDRQRATTFEYLRCPNGHGRLTTFFDFLREKDFIRPLSARQIDELRRHVRTVNCSNCGGAIDLGSGAACPHCGSPLSMLDMAQAEALVARLRAADRRDRPVDPSLPLQLERARREVDAAFAAFEPDDIWFRDASAAGLVGAGLNVVARWLKRNA
jgi:uncharacterized protein YbaR (Trm112 family)